jgi:hypothetical protein
MSELETKKRNTNMGNKQVATEPRHLEVGNLVLAFDRLFGQKRARKIAAHFGQKEVLAFPSCIVLEIMKLKENISVLLNGLNKDDVIWCNVVDNRTRLYQRSRIPPKTYCCYCSLKLDISKTKYSGFKWNVLLFDAKG